MDNLPPRFIVSIGVVVAGVTCGVLTLASYNPLSQTPDHVQAIKVLDDLTHQIERKRYRAAIKHFAPHVQMKIKNVGGGPTPLDGFFLGLNLKLNTRGRIKTARRKVWVSYTTSEGKKTHVAISRDNSGQWLITSIRGQDWGV